MRSFLILFVLLFSVLSSSAQFTMSEKSTREIEFEQYKIIEFYSNAYDDLMDKKRYPLSETIEINRHTIVHKTANDTVYHFISDIEILANETPQGFVTNIKAHNLKNDRDSFYQLVEVEGNIFIIFFEYATVNGENKQIIFKNMFYYVDKYEYIKYKK